MPNNDWKSYPAGSKERYNAAKKDSSVKVGPFANGDYRISTVPAAKKMPTEDEMAVGAEKFFRKGTMKKRGATSGEANRMGDMKGMAMKKAALKAAVAKKKVKPEPDKIQDETRAPNPYLPLDNKAALAKFGRASLPLRKGK